METMKYIDSETEILNTPHFAALVFEFVMIPGDERSRSNPGHGYPEHSESVVKYIEFCSRKDMESWVKSEEKYHTRANYRLIEVKPLSVKREISIE